MLCLCTTNIYDDFFLNPSSSSGQRVTTGNQRAITDGHLHKYQGRQEACVVITSNYDACVEVQRDLSDEGAGSSMDVEVDPNLCIMNSDTSDDLLIGDSNIYPQEQVLHTTPLPGHKSIFITTGERFLDLPLLHQQRHPAIDNLEAVCPTKGKGKGIGKKSATGAGISSNLASVEQMPPVRRQGLTSTCQENPSMEQDKGCAGDTGAHQRHSGTYIRSDCRKSCIIHRSNNTYTMLY
jgi:hypothetical protein